MKTMIKTGALTTILLLALVPSRLWSMQEDEKIVTSYNQPQPKKQSHEYMLGFALIVNMWSPDGDQKNTDATENLPAANVTTDKPAELYPETGK